MRNCSMYLDDEPVIIDGEFVVEDLKAARHTFAPPSVARA
jgi:hypothetical protein